MLKSALLNAADALRPVLLLGQYGLDDENSTELSKFGLWAQEHGVQVIVWPRLSFQDDVDTGLANFAKHCWFGHLQGPFLKLDVPAVIRKHHLLDLPGVCQRHALYTDADIIFANTILFFNIPPL